MTPLDKKTDSTTLLKAIRKKCVECCGGSRLEIDRCNMLNCPLHPYRHGKGETKND